VFQRGDDERYDSENDAAYLERSHFCCYGECFPPSNQVSCHARIGRAAQLKEDPKRGASQEVIFPAAGPVWLDPSVQL
jgi:hypothetical protein